MIHHAPRLFGIVLVLLGMCARMSAQEILSSGQGQWVDVNSGHEGPLKGRFRPVSDDAYRVVFTGRFRQVIPFRFATTLKVSGRDGDNVYFDGQSRVGLFGKFSYSGVATPTGFHAEYSSWRWRGTFTLSGH